MDEAFQVHGCDVKGFGKFVGFMKSLCLTYSFRRCTDVEWCTDKSKCIRNGCEVPADILRAALRTFSMRQITQFRRRGSDLMRTLLPRSGDTLALILTMAFVLVFGAKIINNKAVALPSDPGPNVMNSSLFALSTYGTAAAVLRSGVAGAPMAPALGLAMGDFTGDTHPDTATVELDRFDSANVHYWIEIQLTEGGRQFLKLTAPFGGLRITPRDVTGDGNLDLVVRAANNGVLVAVFLNDGSGHFSRAETTAFAKILQESRSDFEFTTEQPYFGVVFVCTESDMVGCRSESLRNPQKENDFLLLPNRIAPLSVVLSSGSNRAPPVFTTST
jgi:hypothetical protein